MTHSPEPWNISPGIPGRINSAILDSNNVVVSGDGNLRNQERIVACVNACAGIPDEHLERIIKNGLSGEFELNKCDAEMAAYQAGRWWWFEDDIKQPKWLVKAWALRNDT